MDIRKLLLRKIDKYELESKLSSLNTIGERLRFLRKDYLKLSRAKLSEQIGIEANMLNKYENGYFEPKAERIKEFADFYEIPIEFITGENSDSLLKEDYFLISNLHMYCWQIDRGFVKIDNRSEIEIALYKANKIIVKAITRAVSPEEEYYYIAQLFSHDADYDMIIDHTKDNLLAFFDKKIANLETNPNKHEHSLDYISRVLEFGVTTLDILSKSEYVELTECLAPVIQSYKENYKE